MIAKGVYRNHRSLVEETRTALSILLGCLNWMDKSDVQDVAGVKRR